MLGLWTNWTSGWVVNDFYPRYLLFQILYFGYGARHDDRSLLKFYKNSISLDSRHPLHPITEAIYPPQRDEWELNAQEGVGWLIAWG